MGGSGRYPSELPPRRITIRRPFAIGRYEVTFAEWGACADAGGCATVPDDHGWGEGRRPVINVNRAQVRQYLHWLSERTGKTYRLPTEAEWDYANRAGTVTEYWWGDEAGSGHANCRGCGSRWSGSATAPVGSFSPNAFGLYDTTANVWEWVADCWRPDLNGVEPDGTATEGSACRLGTIRGGAWYYVAKTARSAWRSSNDVRVGSYTIGFRVARDLGP